MSSSIPTDEEDDSRVDNFTPIETGAGEAAANFSADAQRAKVKDSLGGSSNSTDNSPNLPGGPYNPRPMTIEGITYEPLSPPKLYRNADGTTEYRGGVPIKTGNSSDIASIREQLKLEAEKTTPPAYKAVFEGVYDQMRQGAFGKTPEEQAQRFVEDIADWAERRIGEINSGNLTNEDIYREMWGKMSGYISRYSGTSRFEEKKADVSAVYLKLKGNINKLVKDGEVDPLTAKVYARNLKGYKRIGGHHYKDIVRNNQEIPEGTIKQKQPEYNSALGRMVVDYGENAKDQDSGGFVHFNADKQTGDVTTRVYITPDLTQSPAQVIDAWGGSIDTSGHER